MYPCLINFTILWCIIVVKLVLGELKWTNGSIVLWPFEGFCEIDRLAPWPFKFKGLMGNWNYLRSLQSFESVLGIIHFVT